MSLFDSEEDLEEGKRYELENFRLEWKGKVYTSVQHMRRELSSEDLTALLDVYDKMILKTERKLTIGEYVQSCLKVLFFVGLGGLIFKDNFSGVVKNVLDILAPVSFVGGGLGVIFNFFKNKPVAEALNDMYFISDEIEEELDLRIEEEINKKAEKEIFSNFYNEDEKQ